LACGVHAVTRSTLLTHYWPDQGPSGGVYYRGDLHYVGGRSPNVCRWVPKRTTGAGFSKGVGAVLPAL
jgi:hypothetical protein